MASSGPPAKKPVYDRCARCGQRSPDVKRDPQLGELLCNMCWVKSVVPSPPPPKHPENG